VFEIHVESRAVHGEIELPAVDLRVGYYDALIFLILKSHGPLTKEFLIRRVIGLGVNADSEGFKTSLSDIRKSPTIKNSAWPMLKLSRYGLAVAKVTENHINSIGDRKGPWLPAIELMAAILRLDGRIELSTIFRLWDFVGGLTDEEAREFHAEKGKTLADYDTWLEVGIGSGVLFWYEGHAFLLALPNEVHKVLLKSSSSFQELESQLREPS